MTEYLTCPPSTLEEIRAAYMPLADFVRKVSHHREAATMRYDPENPGAWVSAANDPEGGLTNAEMMAYLYEVFEGRTLTVADWANVILWVRSYK